MAGLSRSTYYYQPCQGETPYNQYLMKEIDKLYMKHPFKGSPRITKALRKQEGEAINHKRVERLMQVMGLQAVTPGPHTSKPHPNHSVYPYLLRGVQVTEPDQVWCADITYIPMDPGYMYLVAIMDWYSRYVLEWELSNSLENSFCIQALQRALKQKSPDIFNTDQGSQFTSPSFTGTLEKAEIRISMDGRGRALDNVFIERLWWSLKYEEVYLRDYSNGLAARKYLSEYFTYYNTEREHDSLNDCTPKEIYGQN
jgi:putative transposase